MSADATPRTATAPSASDREAVMSALGDAYAADQLELDELERRMAAVYRATSHEALREVLRGLGHGRTVAPVPESDSTRARSGKGRGSAGALDAPLLSAAGDVVSARAYEFGVATIARPEVVPERSVAMAVMGGAERKGAWVVPRFLKAIAVMGGVELDLREAQFGAGVSEIEVFALFGGVDIKVPTGVRLETTGMGIMGGFTVTGADADPGPDAPLLRISGVAIMGGVDAKLKRLRKLTR